MANLSELIRQKEQQTEEWKQRKADERDSLNEMNDAAALRVTESTGAFLHYLDVQADNPRFSASNVLLAMEQNPEVTVFNSVKGWNGLNRIICYDIQDLGENLKPIGLLVMLDSILNRVIRNRQQGRYTHVYIDEIYLFFASPGVGGKSAINNYSSEFLYKCWKRFRKYYATLTGITQNVEECLLSDTARLMFANSEFLVLLNQAPTDRAELAKLLDASDAQMDYVSDAPAGHGLIKVGSCLVPFINELPRDTELYRLMTTKPGEQNA